MKSLEQKNILTTAWVLAATALIGTALMTGINRHSQPYIKKNEREVLRRTLNSVLDADTYNNDILKDTLILPASTLSGGEGGTVIYRARKNGRPAAAILSVTAPNGYSGPIELLVGVYYTGRVAGVRVIKHRETPGLGDGIDYARGDWITRFNDKSLENPASSRWKVKRDGGYFDQLSGATISSRAVTGAVHKALVFYRENRAAIFNENT